MLEAAFILSKPLAQAPSAGGVVASDEPTLATTAIAFGTALVVAGVATAVAKSLGLLSRPEPWRPRLDGFAGWVGLGTGFLLLTLWMFLVSGVIAFSGLEVGDGNVRDDATYGLLLYVGFFTVFAAWLKLRKQRGFKVGLGARRLPQAIMGLSWLGLILPWAWVAMLGTQVVRMMLGQMPDEIHPLLEQMKATTDTGLLVLFILQAVVAAPLAEELIFRGFLQTGLVTVGVKVAGTTSGRRLGIVATSLLFAAVHEPFSWPAIFVLSLFLGWLYERRGNLWLPIMVHAGFNGVQTGLMLLVG